MELLSTFHLKKWVKDNAQLFNPPFRTNQLLVHHKDFLVMILRGPNTRLDFIFNPATSFSIKCKARWSWWSSRKASGAKA